MAGNPVPLPNPEEKILSIADLEKAASAKLPVAARGERPDIYRSFDQVPLLFEDWPELPNEHVLIIPNVIAPGAT